MTKAETILINGHDLNFRQIAQVSRRYAKVDISQDSREKMQKSRDYVLSIVKKGVPVYGINTGFGALADKHIEESNLAQLQLNLVRSHCTGVGNPFNKEVTRAIMLLRANCLASGYSGVNPEAVQMLVNFLNLDICPVVPQKGSVGASGDLAPLSHIALALIGEGEVYFQGEKMPAQKAFDKNGLKPVTLGPKDGLALINGTAVMAALGALALERAEQFMKLADLAACMTLEGVRGTVRAFDPKISKLKPHPGQLACVDNVNHLVANSEIKESHRDCGKVQDPYSLRCVPQVHGACRQTLQQAFDILSIELNSVTDNPLIFVEEDDVISGGNFHGEGLAFCMDYLAMGLSELCNISERRIEKMMNPVFSDLPAFLTKDSGLNSGLMIAHVTAAALASENKGLCHPASVDSIPTSTDKEDHVSMGVTSGRKLWDVLDNLKNILAIEVLCATQALDFHAPLKSSPAIEEVRELVRSVVDPLETDRALYKDMNAIGEKIDSGELIKAVEKHTGGLK